MRVVLFPIFLFILSGYGYTQSNFLRYSGKKSDVGTEPLRTVEDKGAGGGVIEYEFPGSFIFEKKINEDTYKILNIPGFSHLKNTGKPALPVYYDLIAVPSGAEADIEITDLRYEHYYDYLIFPALEPAVDTWGSPDPEFVIDNDFYSSDVTYPEYPVTIADVIKIRGMKIAVVRICPFSYNPAKRKLTVYSYINYKVGFPGGQYFIDKNSHSEGFLKRLPGKLINRKGIREEIELYLTRKRTVGISSRGVAGPEKNYIILTHSDYKQAADSLAQWKRQLGYSVEVISGTSWTSPVVMQEIHDRYNNWSVKPDYFVIIGDHDKVPGKILKDPSEHEDFASDLYYACMDGSDDYVPDIARGRISVSSAAEANDVVSKIIGYEKYPVEDTAFYSKGLNCAMYQDDNLDNYADRRFSLTSENVYDYMTGSQDFDVTRVYYTDAEVNPLYWNEGEYANGEPLPSYLLKPDFPWDGSKTDIIDNINEGVLYVLHRDHGYVGGSGWGAPHFVTSDINDLSNNIKLPVLFSINCHTGEFQLPNCFAEEFLRHDNGGAAGVIAAAYYSYSGYNDGFSIGLFDAIWADPGLIPDFTGEGGVSDPDLTPHGNIYTMGDVMDQALLRMVETWGGSNSRLKYSYQLYHYFGDPAMKIWTDLPEPVTATCQDTLYCDDTVFSVYSSSCADGLATLVANGQLIGKVQLNAGMGEITFASVPGDAAVLTISKHNYAPFIKNIIVDGECPGATFSVQANSFCLGDTIQFTGDYSGNITTYTWDFGNGATPAAGDTVGPYNVIYETPGNKVIALTVEGPGGSYSYSEEIIIDEYCPYFMTGEEQVITDCSGKLYDDGGIGNYSDASIIVTTINPDNASFITLEFLSFNFHANNDYLYIYDGPNTSCPLIGVYTGTSLPGGGTITTSTGAVTFIQYTNTTINREGFEMNWNCQIANGVPVPDFSVYPDTSCTGKVWFYDLSSNAPASWHWDFGDGNVSTDQYPVNRYDNNGEYSVELVATNSFGSDTVIKDGIVIVNRPDGPVTVPVSNCGEGSVTLSTDTENEVLWYDIQTGGEPIHTGQTYTTPLLTETTTYYVEEKAPNQSYFFGPVDTTMGEGGFYTGNSDHYLEFDCFTDIRLVSVKSYSDSYGYRKFDLYNAEGELMDYELENFIDEARIPLNFDIPAGYGYRLVIGNNDPGLYRNLEGASYPYTITGMISITGSSAGEDVYYYFYDWEVSYPPCQSLRVPVTAYIHDNAPSAQFSYINNDPVILFADESTDPCNYLWDFGDGNSSTDQDPVHTYSDTGTYQVVQIVYNGCGSDTAEAEIVIVNESVEEISFINNILIFPNPADNTVNVSFYSQVLQKVNIVMYDVLGRVMMQENIFAAEGRSITTIDLSTMTVGMYYINISNDKGNITRKIFIR